MTLGLLGANISELYKVNSEDACLLKKKPFDKKLYEKVTGSNLPT